MTELDKRSGIKREDLYDLYGAERRASVDFEGGRVVIANVREGSHGEIRLDLTTSEGAHPYVTLYGNFRNYGDGFEFVETGPRGYW
jgi:hypothetical protein